MARFYDLFAIITFLVALMAFMCKNGYAADVQSVAPEPSVVEDPRQLEKCIAKMTQKCGVDIGDAILKGAPPTKECCVLAFQNGFGCHIALTKAVLIERLKLIAAQVLPKSIQVWDNCFSLIQGSLAPS